MDKLIELLNQFEEYRGKVADRTEQDLISYYYIISKKFGFIKWLVDNDKVDLENLIIKKVEDRGGNKVIKDIKYYSEVESLLMLLSISSSPIEDLISYLK